MIVAPRASAARFVAPAMTFDDLFVLWAAAAAEANIAYDVWRDAPGAGAHAVFLAADDRAGAAQDALASFVV